MTGDIHKFTTGLADACVRRGARLICDAIVQDITASDRGIQVTWQEASRAGAAEESSAEAVVICAGVASRRLAARLGDRVNVYPVKGYSITVALDHPRSRHAAPWVSLLDDEAKIVTSRLGPDRLRVAGTAEFNGFNRDIRDDRVLPLLRWTRQLFPDISTEHVAPWAGLRPMMPSMLPRVGAGRRPRVFYNTGHGHLGWTLSAATAGMAADVIDTSLRSMPSIFPGPVATTLAATKA